MLMIAFVVGYLVGWWSRRPARYRPVYWVSDIDEQD